LDYRLRIYEIRSGEMEAWIDEWSRQVVPLRHARGFEVVGGWRGDDDRTFVWIAGYEGDFASADAAYYNSVERALIYPDPARHVERAEERVLRRVL
jgi:hypothetical protein